MEEIVPQQTYTGEGGGEAVENGVIDDDDDDEIMGTISERSFFFWTKNRMKWSLVSSCLLTFVALCIVVPIVVVTNNKTIGQLRQNAKLLKGTLWVPMGNNDKILGVKTSSDDNNNNYDGAESIDLSGDGNVLAIGSTSIVNTDENEGDGKSNTHGIVQVRKYSGTKWVVSATIPGSNQYFGSSIQLSKDGTIVVIGGEGDGATDRGEVKAYQFDSEKNVWNQIGDIIMGDAKGDQFGISLSLASDGRSFIVGADNLRGPSQERNGYARVYTLQESEKKPPTWVTKGSTIYGLNNDRTGYAVAMSGDGQTICVGDRWYKVPNVGKRGRVRCYVWSNDGEAWKNQGRYNWEKLPNDLVGTIDNGEMGYSLALNEDGSRLAVGNRNGSTDLEGYVAVFERNLKKKNKPWKQMGKSQVSVRRKGDNARGYQVALNAEGNILAWTARGYDTTGIDQGIVRIAQYEGGKDWNVVGNDLLGDTPEDFFGDSVALNDFGNIVAASANVGTDEDYVRAYTFQ